MLRTLALVAVALTLLLAPAAHAQKAKDLVGRYVMEADPSEVLELRADGTASMAGDSTTWSVKGNQLTVGPDTLAFRLAGGRLLLSMGSVELAWKRVGAAGAERKRAPTVAAPDKEPSGGGNPQDGQLRQLLTSSAWCSFTYNQHTGTSTTQRVVFRTDGVVFMGSGTETYNSGANGSVAGQSGSQGGARWRVANLRLFVDLGAGAGFQDVGLTGTKNSNGYPILKAGGREYSMCK